MASNINADGIDADYPIAGTNNSSQGFRDNFFTIKNNLNYARTELDDLQAKAILKSALNGQELNNDMSETVLANAALRSTSQVINDIGGVAGPVQIDFSVANYYLLSTLGSVSLTFTDWPTAGLCGAVRVVMKINSKSHKVTVPGYVNKGLENISGVASVTSNGLIIEPPTTIVNQVNTTTTTTTTAPSGSTTTTTVAPGTVKFVYQVTETQIVGDSINPVQFIGTTVTGSTAVFRGFINGTTLNVVDIISGTIILGMTIADTKPIVANVINFDTPGTYVFDFETIDHGTSILILDQSRGAGGGSNYSLLPATTTRLGGVKVGTSLQITADGILNPRAASTTMLGAIKVGQGLTITSGDTLNTSAALGISSTPLSNSSTAISWIRNITSIDNLNYIPSATLGQWYRVKGIYDNVMLRTPLPGAYRVRVVGRLSFNNGTIASGGKLRIYINGTNRSPVDIAFTSPASLTQIPNWIDTYQDFTNLAKGDKIEIYVGFALGTSSRASLICDFNVILAGDNDNLIGNPLSDWTVVNNKLFAPWDWQFANGTIVTPGGGTTGGGTTGGGTTGGGAGGGAGGGGFGSADGDTGGGGAGGADGTADASPDGGGAAGGGGSDSGTGGGADGAASDSGAGGPGSDGGASDGGASDAGASDASADGGSASDASSDSGAADGADGGGSGGSGGSGAGSGAGSDGSGSGAGAGGGSAARL
jgi:hypothetical protein